MQHALFGGVRVSTWPRRELSAGVSSTFHRGQVGAQRRHESAVCGLVLRLSHLKLLSYTTLVVKYQTTSPTIPAQDNASLVSAIETKHGYTELRIVPPPLSRSHASSRLHRSPRKAVDTTRLPPSDESILLVARVVLRARHVVLAALHLLPLQVGHVHQVRCRDAILVGWHGMHPHAARVLLDLTCPSTRASKKKAAQQWRLAYQLTHA